MGADEKPTEEAVNGIFAAIEASVLAAEAMGKLRNEIIKQGWSEAGAEQAIVAMIYTQAGVKQ